MAWHNFDTSFKSHKILILNRLKDYKIPVIFILFLFPKKPLSKTVLKLKGSTNRILKTTCV